MNNPFQSHHTSRVAPAACHTRLSQDCHKLWRFGDALLSHGPNKYSGQPTVSVVTNPQRLDVTAFSRLTEPPSNRLTHARSAMTPETRIAGIQVDD